MLQNVKHKGLALLILAAAQFMVILDASIVNVALPAIQKLLQFSSEAQLQWIITAYGLIYGGFLLLGGRLADMFGRRRLFLIGTALFTVASLAAGFAQSSEMLIVFRAIQGLGAAMLSPAALSLILTIFHEARERAKALGVWSMVAGTGGAVGLMLGGAITQYASWQWIFLINIPIAALVVAMTLRYLPKSEVAPGARSLDLVGAVTVTGGLMSFVYALAQLPELGWASLQTLGMLGLSAVLLAAFIVNELRVKRPLIDLSIFKRRNVTGGTLINLLFPAAMFGMFFFLSIYLQRIGHYSPIQTGFANLPITLMIIFVSAFVSRRILGKINPKHILIVTPLIAALGLLYMARLPLEANYWFDILPSLVLLGIGVGGTFVTNSVMATSSVELKESGTISGLLNTSLQIGGAIGLAVLSVVSTNVTRDGVAAAHGNAGLIAEAQLNGFHMAFIAGALFAIAAAVVAAVVVQRNRYVAKAPVIEEAAAKIEAEIPA